MGLPLPPMSRDMCDSMFHRKNDRSSCRKSPGHWDWGHYCAGSASPLINVDQARGSLWPCANTFLRGAGSRWPAPGPYLRCFFGGEYGRSKRRPYSRVLGSPDSFRSTGRGRRSYREYGGQEPPYVRIPPHYRANKNELTIAGKERSNPATGLPSLRSTLRANTVRIRASISEQSQNGKLLGAKFILLCGEQQRA